jgi:hypothetical protein
MPERRTASRSPRRVSRAQPFTCPREAWRQLLAAVDRAFHACERYWYQGRYYVRHERTFLALVREPGNDHIEARIAATARPRWRAARDTFWDDHPERDTPPPHLHVIPIRDRGDIACALKTARRARRRWGARKFR